MAEWVLVLGSLVAGAAALVSCARGMDKDWRRP